MKIPGICLTSGNSLHTWSPICLSRLMIGHCLQDTDTSASESALIFVLRKKWLCLQSTFPAHDQQITIVVLDRIHHVQIQVAFVSMLRTTAASWFPVFFNVQFPTCGPV